MDQIIPIAPPPAILIKDVRHWNWTDIESEVARVEWENGPNFKTSHTKDFFSSSIDSIKQQIVVECENFAKHICPIDFKFNLSMTTSWVNDMRTGDFHPWHTHPFSVVSGVIFLDDCPENLNLMFKTSIKDAIPPYSLLELDYYTSVKKIVEPDNNLQYHMILFYSNILHSVPILPNTTCRRTISFNTFWTGQVDFGEPLNSHNFK